MCAQGLGGLRREAAPSLSCDFGRGGLQTARGGVVVVVVVGARWGGAAWKVCTPLCLFAIFVLHIDFGREKKKKLGKQTESVVFKCGILPIGRA